MKLSVVIPAYNESENIQHTLAELNAVIVLNEHIAAAEYIVVDDCSDDDTYEKVVQLSSQFSNVFCIKFSRRSGSHAAIRAGLQKCSGDMALCISADGQDDPVIFDRMIQKVVDQGCEVVWGVRENRDEPFLQKIYAILFYKILVRVTSTSRSKIDLANADFYLLGRKIINAINECAERNTSLFGLIVWLGFKQDSVVYKRRERRSGKSKWNFKSKTKLAFDWIIAFSGLPLKMMTYLGFLFSILGLLYALVLIWLGISGKTTPGWAEEVILSLIIGGVQMMMLGVLGEYIWRNLDESRKRPLYFIEKTNMHL